MHTQELTLIGPAEDVSALQHALVAAGAVHDIQRDQAHLTWRGDVEDASTEAIAAAHPAVETCMRSYDDGDVVREIAITRGHVAVDRERRIFRAPDGDVSCAWGLTTCEDGDRLDPVLLRHVADEILATEHDQVGQVTGGISDALVLAERLGDFARVVRCGTLDAEPGVAELDALRVLASLALTLACASTPDCAAEMTATRAWRMREVLVHAGHEELWARPGDASWREWLGHVISSLTDAIEACVEVGWMPVTALADADDDSQSWSPDRHLETSMGGLVSTCLQTLALFASAGMG